MLLPHTNTNAAAVFAAALASSAAGSDYLAWVPPDYKDAFKCSDVIFMKPGTIEQYQAFRADREAWGYRGAFPHKALGKTTSLDPDHIKAAQALGMKYVGSTVAAIHTHWKMRPELTALAGESFDGAPLPRRLSEYKKPMGKRSWNVTAHLTGGCARRPLHTPPAVSIDLGTQTRSLTHRVCVTPPAVHQK